MLEAARGSAKRSCSSRTSHSSTEFEHGTAAQTRNGLLGTGASDVKMAVLSFADEGERPNHEGSGQNKSK